MFQRTSGLDVSRYPMPTETSSLASAEPSSADGSFGSELENQAPRRVVQKRRQLRSPAVRGIWAHGLDSADYAQDAPEASWKKASTKLRRLRSRFAPTSTHTAKPESAKQAKIQLELAVRDHFPDKDGLPVTEQFRQGLDCYWNALEQGSFRDAGDHDANEIVVAARILLQLRHDRGAPEPEQSEQSDENSDDPRDATWILADAYARPSNHHGV